MHTVVLFLLFYSMILPKKHASGALAKFVSNMSRFQTKVQAAFGNIFPASQL